MLGFETQGWARIVQKPTVALRQSRFARPRVKPPSLDNFIFVTQSIANTQLAPQLQQHDDDDTKYRFRSSRNSNPEAGRSNDEPRGEYQKFKTQRDIRTSSKPAVLRLEIDHRYRQVSLRLASRPSSRGCLVVFDFERRLSDARWIA